MSISDELVNSPLIHYHVYTIPPLVPVMSQQSSHKRALCFFELHLNIILSSTPIPHHCRLFSI